ncbi:AAA family ATPase [Gottfriedia sp. S16(2024)]|uniref:AAA family ATPase n=1 Tax=Gottfriedia sp. S16(2024) TaxID=3162883 RepID=UPI003D1CCF44
MSNGFLIRNIYIKNFRGYEEKTFAFFERQEENRGLILLSGSNGYGKTSLLDAIEWCFTGTVQRLKEDYIARKEKKNKNLKKCLIRHNGRNEDVIVEVNAVYKLNDVTIRRVFNGADESLAFAPDYSQFFVNGNNILEQKTIDYVLDEPISKDFYERYTCSYEKNLRVYEKSRENIYDMFSSFFGGTKEIETIITNLDGDKKDKNKRGIIDQLDLKIKTEIKLDFDKKKEKYEETVEELNSLLKAKQNNEIEDMSTLIYPKQLLFNEEEVPESILDSKGNMDEKVIHLKKQRNYLKNIKIIQDKAISYHYSTQFKADLEKRRYYDEFIKRIYHPYAELKEEITSIQGKTIQAITEVNQMYRLYHKDLLKSSKPSLEGVKILKDLSTKLKNINVVQIEQFKTIDSKLVEYQNIEAELKGFNSADDELNAMRLLVDHKSGFEIHRSNGHKKCPLCGSEENFANQNILIASIAKNILGEIDTKRNELQQKLTDYQKEVNIIYQSFYEYLDTIINIRLKNQKNLLSNFNMLNEFANYCNLFNLNLDELSEVTINQKKHNLENELPDDKKIQSLEEMIIKGLIGDNEVLFGMLDTNGNRMSTTVFQLLDTNGKINAIQLFIKEYQNIKEAFPLIMEVDKVNPVDLESKIALLDQLIIHLETDEELTLKQKKVLNLKSSYRASEEAYIKKIKELEKLKEILKELKNVRNQWDKKMVENLKIPLQQIYRRINRHTNIQDINLLVQGKTNPLASLNANVNNEEVAATNILSAGQLSVMALAIFLTISMGQKENTFKCFFLDDPIQTMDDLNILSFIDLLRTELAVTNKNNRFIDQLFFTTCDENLERLITHKMKSFGVNYTHIHFTGYGDATVLV